MLRQEIEILSPASHERLAKNEVRSVISRLCVPKWIFLSSKERTKEDTKISLNPTQKMVFSFIIISIFYWRSMSHSKENQSMQRKVRELSTCAWEWRGHIITHIIQRSQHKKVWGKNSNRLISLYWMFILLKEKCRGLNVREDVHLSIQGARIFQQIFCWKNNRPH